MSDLLFACYSLPMHAIKARVRNGQLELEEPAALAEGAEFWIVPAEDDGMSDDERAELREALLEGIADVEAGRTVDAEEAIAALRQQ